MKTIKPTIKTLTEECAVLRNKVHEISLKHDTEDMRLRTVLCELLGNYYVTTDRWGGGGERKVDVLSWEGIAFKVGELKADANYSAILMEKENLSRECQQLIRENFHLKNPKSKNDGDDTVDIGLRKMI